MAIKTEKFQLGKEVSTKEINEFFRASRLDRTQVLHVGVIQKAPNVATYLITYEDVTAPYVVATSPDNGFVEVPVNSDIVIQMSEQVAQVNWTAGADTDVEVRKNGSLVSPGTVVPSGGSWPSSGFTLQNAVDGDNNANYQVTLKTTIQDTLGNTMTVAYVFTFTTVGQVSGMSFKQGRLTPNGQQIGSGWADITFASPMPSANYRVADSLWNSDSIADPSGLPLRWDPAFKTVDGARVFFDFPFPAGAMVEWLAYYGAEDTLNP
jgi:hypothetical protein